MIDIHCHILPGIDDGAQNLADSLKMARKAVEEGIDTIVATPHYIQNRYINPKQTILAKVEELNEALTAENINLKILPGQEPRIDGELLKSMDRGEIITLTGSPYIFIEFPSSHVPRYTEQLFYDLQTNGLIPVIVHPERNQEIIQHPDRLYQLVEKGALTQLTASSVCGDLGKKIKTFSTQLIEHNLTHFVASDAHNITTRSFKLREAYQVISATFGIDIEMMLKENAELLVAGQNVYKEIPEPIKKKRFFNIF
ncbi:tyrosine-protein phosphatase [Bacillota bacterium Lsc_1132]